MTIINRHPGGEVFDPAELRICRKDYPEIYRILEGRRVHAGHR